MIVALTISLFAFVVYQLSREDGPHPVAESPGDHLRDTDLG